MPILSVLDHTGDSTFEFDAKNADAVAEARKRFKELAHKGFVAFERHADGRQQITRELNLTAEETVFISPMLAGPWLTWPKPPPPLRPTTIAQRIALARWKKDLSQSDLAEKVGVTRGAVGQWETGATEPSDANLRRVATETDTSYEWLATGRGAVGYFQPLKVPDRLGTGGLELAGAVEAGVFRAPELEPEKLKRAPVWPDFRYARASQYAWEVRGDGMNLAGIEDGSYVVATTLEEFKKKYGPLKDGSLVIVQRWRGGTASAERELSILEYHFADADHIELRPRSTNKAHKSYFVRQLAAEDSGSGQPQIIGVILAAIRPFYP
jgi:transcriptional regulator with XRE-family HTH domain